jgi:hypothetical protein
MVTTPRDSRLVPIIPPYPLRRAQMLGAEVQQRRPAGEVQWRLPCEVRRRRRHAKSGGADERAFFHSILISSGMGLGAILSLNFSLNLQNTIKYFKRANYIVIKVKCGKLAERPYVATAFKKSCIFNINSSYK